MILFHFIENEDTIEDRIYIKKRKEVDKIDYTTTFAKYLKHIDHVQ
jgi:hypothetical protein